VEDSIEERVLQRLLTKIEIFKESIGEPDPIIGEEIERLTGRALQGDLSPEELDRLGLNSNQLRGWPLLIFV
jgi:NifB/MoaA-like Fe-S oxidoreductase